MFYGSGNPDNRVLWIRKPFAHSSFFGDYVGKKSLLNEAVLKILLVREYAENLLAGERSLKRYRIATPNTPIVKIYSEDPDKHKRDTSVFTFLGLDREKTNKVVVENEGSLDLCFMTTNTI